MQLIRSFTNIILSLVCLVVAVTAQSGADKDAVARGQCVPTDEERIVKLAYMKLMFYQRIAVGQRVELDKRSPVADDLVRFQISNIKTGPIEDIYDRPYGEVVTRGLGDVIQISPVVTTFNNGAEEYVSYETAWGFGHYTTMEDWHRTTVREVLQILGPTAGDIGKYTSYEVRVRLRGRERAYRALVLYHTPQITSEAPRAEIIDMITGGGTVLTKLYQEGRPPLYAKLPGPGDLPRAKSERNAEQPASARAEGPAPQSGARHLPDPFNVEHPESLRGGWLAAEASPCGRGQRAEQGRTPNYARSPGCGPDESLCCDAWSGECCWNPGYYWNPGFFPTCYSGSGVGSGGGGGGTDPAVPVCAAREVDGSTGPGPGPDAQYHLVGQHEVTGTLRPKCRYRADCSINCVHTISDVSSYDWGLVTSFMHVVHHGSEVRDSGTADGLSQNVTCSAAVGGMAKECFLGLCSLQLAITGTGLGMTVKSDGFWTYSHSNTWTCGPATRIN